MTLQTIADRVGVSRMTVSNAFSRPDQLSDELRAKVLAAADELGYVGPDPAARALARGSTGAVGMLLTDSLSEAFGDWVATTFLASVADSLASSGLALTLLTPGGPNGIVPARDVAMDGALVYVCGPDSQDVAWLKRRRLPIVGVDQKPIDGVPNVNVDDLAGGRAGAQHLIDLGHRRFGILTLGFDDQVGLADVGGVDPYGMAGQMRMKGWLEVLEAADVVPIVSVAPFRPVDAAYDSARLLLESEDRPTAILCYSDVFASETIRAAVDLGLRVPEDVSVIGYDDTPLAGQLKLTTINQDIPGKAQAAVTLLANVLKARANGTAEPTDHVAMPVKLVVRSTTGPAPQPAKAKAGAKR